MNLTLTGIVSRLLSKIKFANIGYSQEGEDVIIDRFLNYRSKGFFIDVGAHHPIYLSNTYRFYLRGWQGINIDAMPGSMKVFNKIRPRDINIEAPISDKEEELTYYIFNDPALNTLSEEEANKKNNLNDYKIIQTTLLRTQTLEKILDEHLNQNQEIDFLSIDVEGFDLKVLSSNNWNKYRPSLVAVECLNKGYNLDLITSDPTYLFMKRIGYQFCAKTLNTFIFIQNDRLIF